MARQAFSTNVPACTADPIQVMILKLKKNITDLKICQELFVNKIRAYGEKKAAAGGAMVDATPETQAELQAELDEVAKAYGGGAGVDMSAFPEFSFAEPTIDPINISA